MHELGIADALVRRAAQHAGGRCVTKVHVKVGRLLQVAPASLTFGFELAAQGTELAGAVLEIHEVAPTVRCRRCDAERDVPGFPLRCPSCASLDVEVIAGNELLVEAIEVEETGAAPGRQGDAEPVAGRERQR